MKKQTTPAQPVVWTRADPEALAAFDPETKLCTMNCGPSSDDPRTGKERKFLCDDCVPVEPVWLRAERVCDVPAVHEALFNLTQDATHDNAVGVIAAVLEAIAKGKA